MAIKYKVVKRSEAGVKGGGAAKYHAVATGRSVVDTRELSKMVSDRCTARAADVRVVLTQLSEIIPELLMKGYSVQFEDIGIFSATLASQIKDTPEEVNESSIKGLRIQFRADKWLKKKMKYCDFRRVKT